jgi:predicted ATPase with chaperone activity
MPIKELFQSEEISAFRKRLLEIINDHSGLIEEASGAKICSEIGDLIDQSAAMVEQIAPPLEHRPECRLPSPLNELAQPLKKEFLPLAVKSLPELGLRSSDVEAIVLKFLLNSGSHCGFEIAKQLRIPLSILTGLLRQMKEEQLLVYKATGAAGDFLYELTEGGIQRARRYWEHCTYYGAIPVSLKDYIASVHAQSVRKQNPKIREIQRALDGLSIPHEMITRLAQAVNSGLGLFLFGASGNGKTTIACRLAQAFGERVWIPRAINVGGSIMRLYDPNNHITPASASENKSESSGIDERWIQIRRPTMIVGGELTLDSFEVRSDPVSGVSEAPIQLKSNCGVLVIDDFGRQRVSPNEILNRWIVPLAQRFDILNMRNGRKFEFPIDQLVIFSTNLEPKALVDEAFLRRIPYKIDVGNPSEDEYRGLLKKIAAQWGIKYHEAPVEYLIEKHYKSCQREMRYCHPYDILHQVYTYCNVLNTPLEITVEAIDSAASNYFTLL